MDEYPYWAAAKSAVPWEQNRAFQRLADEAALVGREQQLPEREFHWAIEQLYAAYSSFLDAMNPARLNPPEQVHWYNHFRQARLSKKLGEPPISQELLSEAAYKYLKGPMRVPMVDRGLIDALIAQETFAYIDRHAGRGAVTTQVGCFVVWFVLWVILEVIFGSLQMKGLWRGIGAIIALALVIWVWPWRGPYVLYQSMKDPYQLLSGSVVSVPELRRRIERARDRGVVWPAELYAVLDDVEGRTKVLS